MYQSRFTELHTLPGNSFNLGRNSHSSGLLSKPPAGKSVNVTVYGDPASGSSSVVSGAVGGCVNYFNLHRLNGSAVISTVSATVNTQQTKTVDFFIPGLVGFSILVGPDVFAGKPIFRI